MNRWKYPPKYLPEATVNSAYFRFINVNLTKRRHRRNFSFNHIHFRSELMTNHSIISSGKYIFKLISHVLLQYGSIQVFSKIEFYCFKVLAIKKSTSNPQPSIFFLALMVYSWRLTQYGGRKILCLTAQKLPSSLDMGMMCRLDFYLSFK